MTFIPTHCVPCREGAPILKAKELDNHMDAIDKSWELFDKRTKLKRDFVFKNFREAIEFINEIAQVAEREGHHPNIYVYDYKKVKVELWTHKINGLHQNDFILALAIDRLYKTRIDTKLNQ